MRQVTHALLTRPPLSHSSLRGVQSASFDLHVLGTPPAFILSQDQTLMLNSLLSSPESSGFPSLFALQTFLDFTVLFGLVLSNRFVLWNSSANLFAVFGIFRVALLFICQGSVCCCCSAATLLSYHAARTLSTTFLNFFKFLCFCCFPRNLCCFLLLFSTPGCDLS